MKSKLQYKVNYIYLVWNLLYRFIVQIYENMLKPDIWTAKKRGDSVLNLLQSQIIFVGKNLNQESKIL